MTDTKYPPGWDEERVKRVLAHYEQQSDDEAVAEDEATYESTTHTAMEVPVDLVPAAGGVGPLAEGVEHVVVDVDRDPCLSALTDHWTPLALAEVVFLFHIGVSRSA